MTVTTEAHKAGRAAYQAAKTTVYRDISRFSYRIKNASRRKRCRDDLLAFLQLYTPEAFSVDFSPSHLRLIEDTQRVIRGGGQICVAMPRGSGKSTILTRALLWGSLYGHRRFPIIITASFRPHFVRIFKTIKDLLLYNDRLAGDFPEVVLPVRELEGQAISAHRQHWASEKTGIEWSMDQLRFPITPISRRRKNAGVAMGGGGILSALRGINSTLPDGDVIRPDCLLFDDVQSRQSADSLPQTDQRYEAVYDALAMAGPGKRMAAMMACTVIREGDLSDLLLSENCPEWSSHRVKTLEIFPRDLEAWQEGYDIVRREELAGEREAGSANSYYTEHRSKLDAGAVHFWPVVPAEGKVSRIQEAMDEYLENPASFFAERQNQPQKKKGEGELEDLRAADLCQRQRGLKEGIIPKECTTLTGFVDVQSEVLFYSIVAWTPEFGGHIVTYGTFPPRRNRYFSLSQIKRGNTLSRRYPDHDEPGRITQGLIELLDLINVEYMLEGGTKLRPSLILVDHGWQPDAVERGIRESTCSQALAAKGFGIGAARAPMAMWPKKPGERRGNHWIVRPVRAGQLPLLDVDTNYWKTEVYHGLACPATNQIAITFFRAPPSHHRMYADHLVAERAVKVEAMGRVVAEWLLRKPGVDNHYGDTLVGSMAAASFLGIAKHEHGKVTAPQAPRLSIGRGTRKHAASI